MEKCNEHYPYYTITFTVLTSVYYIYTYYLYYSILYDKETLQGIRYCSISISYDLVAALYTLS
jgi:hypothetical protein